MKYKENFARNLLLLRQRDGLTQHQIARKLGINFSRYQHWERGSSLPHDLERLVEISLLFDVPVDTLFKELLVAQQPAS